LDDLATLGLDDGAIAALPRCTSLPQPSSAAGLLGCLYVREGATLGGAVLAARVAHLASDANGRRFFLGAGDHQRGWRTCCAAIEREAARPGALGEMIGEPLRCRRS
jgi:heme oxygenase